MKKTVIASVAFAAALFAVSCQKETNPAQNVSGPLTISAVSEGLNTPTKTELAFKYDVLWSSTDKIYVVDGQGNHDTFSLQGGEGTTKGTFKQDGKTTLTGEVQAYYPATMLEGGSPVWPASQTNDQTIPMYCKKTLSGATEERMDFSSLGSVLQIVFNTTQENVTLKSIEIKDGSATLSGAFTVDTDGKAVITATDKAGITLNLGTGVALGKAANYFNIAVPAGNYQDLTLVFTATDGTKCTMTKGKVNITYNAVGRLTLMGEKFKADVPVGALSGVFTVADPDGIANSGDETKVHFSQGNLTYDVNASTNKWKFYEHQYDCATSYDPNLISLFTWGYDAQKSIIPNGSGTDNVSRTSGELTQTEDWGCTIGDGIIWRTLSTAEWQYLFNTRTMEKGGARSENLTSSGITVEGVTFKGVVLFPDDFTNQADWKTKYTTWKALNDAGIVFLPAAGYRDGSGVWNVGALGFYWSSTADDERNAYNVSFNMPMHMPMPDVNPGEHGCRAYGYSVRLITDASVTPAPTPTTTGTAKRTGDIDINWVQLWAGGPKFAEYNVGASSVTETGTTMTFTEATKAGAEYVWGANWCTPSKEDMEHLMTAAKGVTDEKVNCEIVSDDNNIIGFKFTGKEAGYTGNSVFFPAQDCRSASGSAFYWSATADDSKACYMLLLYSLGGWGSYWGSDDQGSSYLVRPVLKN